ncbi:MAG: glycosyltransferase family 4 protein [Candidatus Lokiarchaeia archaeon]
MDITFVTPHLTLYGGGGIFIMNYANNLCERGHKLTVVTQKINQNDYKFNPNVSIIEIGGPLPTNPFHWVLLRFTKKKFFKVLNKIKADFIISINFPSNYFCSNIYSHKGKKHIFYCHEPYRYIHDKNFYSKLPIFQRIFCWFLRVFFKKYDLKSASEADAIICNSNYTKHRVKEIYHREGYLHYSITNIPEPDKLHDIDIFKELKIEHERPIVFVLGLTHHLKGAKDTIYIFNKIIKELPEAVLLIGGRLLKKNKIICKKLINKLKIPNKNVVFYGFIDNEKLNYFYANSTLTLYPSIDEPYGLIPLESMRMGTPVIAYKGGGPSETIKDGQTGFLIDNFDLNDFADKAIKLIKDKNLCDSFSENAKNYMENFLTFKKAVDNLESILKTLLSEL